MAYTREMAQGAMPVGDPGVVPLVINHTAVGSSAPKTTALKVPWNHVKFVYAYTVVTTAVNSKAVLNISVTDGTNSLATGTVAKSAAVGTVGDLTMAKTAAANRGRNNLMNSSTLTVSVYGGASAAGQAMLYLYFEPKG